LGGVVAAAASAAAAASTDDSTHISTNIYIYIYTPILERFQAAAQTKEVMKEWLVL
jgi:hypothetical protein